MPLSILSLFGIVSIAWQWLLQGMAIQRAFEGHLSNSEINFYRGKWVTFQYFFHYELPRIKGLAMRLKEGDGLTTQIEQAWFDD